MGDATSFYTLVLYPLLFLNSGFFMLLWWGVVVLLLLPCDYFIGFYLRRVVFVMRGWFGWLRGRLGSDRGDSLVTAILVFPLVMSLIVTGVDFGFYLNNASVVKHATRDGARTISILGGDKANVISNKYGAAMPQSTEVNCGGLSVTECHIKERLMGRQNQLVQADVDSVKCGPDVTSAVGEQTWCTVRWRYRGLPWSTLGFIGEYSDTKGEKQNGLGFVNVTTGYSAAETSLR